jgi:CDP-glucose 4,6-dehydratase
MFWSGRAVVVTGAADFLGSHLVGMLVDLGAEVVAVIQDELPATPIRESWHDRVTVVRGAVEDPGLVERVLGNYGVETVFHLAAQSRAQVGNDHPVAAFQANIAGTWILLEAARRTSGVAQVVVAGTDEIYGNSASPAFDEDVPLRTLDPYTASRGCADLLARSYAYKYALPVVVSRCGQFFGPGDIDWRGLIPGTIRALVEGRRPVVSLPRTLTRDYLYVIDGALSHLQLAERLAEQAVLAGEAFNFSTERPLSVLELVEMLQIASGTRLEAELQDPNTAEPDRRSLSAAKARQLLGWAPGHTIEEALILTLRWYRDYLSNPEAAAVT